MSDAGSTNQSLSPDEKKRENNFSNNTSANSGSYSNISAIVICLIIRANYTALYRNLMRIVHTASRWPDNLYYIVALRN